MKNSIRIGVAEDEPDMREFYQIVLSELGHTLLWMARDGTELVQKYEQQRPELLIIDIKMPFMDGIDAVRSITRDDWIPVIVVSGYHDQETMERAQAEQILSYLIKPIREADIEAAIGIAMCRFEQFEALRNDENRATIFAATRTMMGLGGLSEPQAFQRLQQLATKENRTLSEISRTILGAANGPSDTVGSARNQQEVHDVPLR